MTVADENKLFTEACVQGGDPPCTCECPFNFNVKSFIKKIKSANFNSAYRDYSNKVIFPAVVSKICDARCRAKCPEAISVLDLEKAAVKYTSDRDPQRYNLPKRSGAIAIIGGGLSGLACAHKLAVKKYDVTIFERGKEIGGSLKEVMSEQEYMKEFNLQFKDIEYDIVLGKEIKSLDRLDFTAVYIATGKEGNDFNLLEGWNSQSLATVREGVFLGGKITGGGHVDALAQGIMAAISIERFLKIQSMSGEAEFFYNHKCTLPPAESINKTTPVRPADGQVYTKHEALCEASRCILCDCTKCFDTCEFMKETAFLPKRLEAEAIGARHVQQGLFERVGTRMIASCTLCGHCESVCNNNVSIEKLLQLGKMILHDQGHFAPAYHDFYLRDMNMMMDEAYISKVPLGCDKAQYIFFPGCQVASSNPDYVEEAYSYMIGKYPNTAMMMACCGVPALYAGQIGRMNELHNVLRGEWESFGKPILVVACANCMKTFDEFLPEIPMISLFEYICENGLPESHTKFEGKWAVFDPCSSRKFPGMQKAVRMLSNQLGTAKPEELTENGSNAICCGMGGHIYAANPNLTLKFLNRAIKQSDLPYIAYCANCRNLFIFADKPVMHILDAVFGIQPLKSQVHIAQLKRNRLKLKKSILKKYWNEDVGFDILNKERRYKLIFSEELYKKMDSLFISEDDVYAVIEKALDDGIAVFDKEKETFFAHRVIGIITYWVEYKKEEAGSINVMNVYSHRVEIS